MKINWLEISNISGSKGTHEVSLTAEAYEGYREMGLLVSNATKSKRIEVEQDDTEDYFYFDSVGTKADDIWLLERRGSESTYNVYYKYGKRGAWTLFNKGMNNSIRIAPGERVYFKGVNTVTTHTRFALSFTSKNETSDSSIALRCGGSVLTLLGSGLTDLPQVEGVFIHLFAECYHLLNAPELPFTRLTRECYLGMFKGCWSLIEPPVLPATTLAESCYMQMFEDCYSLTNPPTLPAMVMERNCYNGMFGWCYSLTHAPELPATTLAEFCYLYMFRVCDSLTNPPALPATTLAVGCYEYMFENCDSLTTAPALPATTLAEACYVGMFQECGNLVNAPILPAATLVQGCYNAMFQDCSKLGLIKCYATNGSSGDNTRYWLNGTKRSGTFYKKAGASFPTGVHGIPSGWSIVEE